MCRGSRIAPRAGERKRAIEVTGYANSIAEEANTKAEKALSCAFRANCIAVKARKRRTASNCFFLEFVSPPPAACSSTIHGRANPSGLGFPSFPKKRTAKPGTKTSEFVARFRTKPKTRFRTRFYTWTPNLRGWLSHEN